MGPVPKEEISTASRVESFRLETGTYKIFISESSESNAESKATVSLNHDDQVKFSDFLFRLRCIMKAGLYRIRYLRLLPMLPESLIYQRNQKEGATCSMFYRNMHDDTRHDTLLAHTSFPHVALRYTT